MENRNDVVALEMVIRKHVKTKQNQNNNKQTNKTKQNNRKKKTNKQTNTKQNKKTTACASVLYIF